MTAFKSLSDTMFVSEQIGIEDVARAKAQGVTMIVNNRPDGESPDQTAGSDIAGAARAHGIDYRAIPVTQAGFGEPQIAAMTDALRDAATRDDGKVLAYCRSGTRSTFLWSLSKARDGMPAEDIRAAAAGAGYDVTPVVPTKGTRSERTRE